MKIYIQIDEQNRVIGWSSTSGMEGEIEVEIPEDHEFFISPFSVFVYSNGSLVKDDTYLLEMAKRRKDAELNDACNQAILAGFDHTINGVTYHFSFDLEAQLNFIGAERLLSKGLVTSINWTVQRDGQYERIPITKEILDELSVTILQHKNSNISKYRDVLLPRVYSATTIEEVESITWDSA